jgi:GT2 family glycosyltransferase
MKSSHKVSIGWPDNGQVHGEFAVSLAMLATNFSDKLGPFIRVEGSGLISRMRNEIVSTFLNQTNSDWLLMIDSDEKIDSITFKKLIDAAHHIERPVMAGLVFAAFNSVDIYPEPVPSIYNAVEGGFAPISNYPVDEVIRIDAAGTGCLLVHRSVLEKIQEFSTEHEAGKWCWFQDFPIDGTWWGEDLIFCSRVNNAGFPIHAHTGAILPHRKSFWLTNEHHDRFKKIVDRYKEN